MTYILCFNQNKVNDARAILERIYPAHEVESEMSALAASIEAEKADEAAMGENLIARLKGAFKNTVVRRGLYAGITVQVQDLTDIIALPQIHVDVDLHQE